jgi:hypothetical protein
VQSVRGGTGVFGVRGRSADKAAGHPAPASATPGTAKTTLLRDVVAAVVRFLGREFGRGSSEVGAQEIGGFAAC